MQVITNVLNFFNSKQIQFVLIILVNIIKAMFEFFCSVVTMVIDYPLLIFPIGVGIVYCIVKLFKCDF
ncbi:MAG: hypothetical protein J6D28_01540 [Bacilli bacterium]|nr:hypothetical protein [Bacilli bacterium]